MKNIVTIGGGTGSYTLLSGLKEYPFDISTIVSMADDGGSTGRLRDELGVLPPGDVRQCLVALSEESDILRALFNYRFESGSLEGHSMGNLFLSALEKITGSFSKGLDEAMKILKIKGRVIPVSNDNIRLFMELSNGTMLVGEKEIYQTDKITEKGIRRVYLSPKAEANSKALERIKVADVVVIGPGNIYCSIVPNLLVKGVPEAIVDSKAKVVFVPNLVNKKGQTDNLRLDDCVDLVNSYLGKDRIDFVLRNVGRPPKILEQKYRLKGENLVVFGSKDRQFRNYGIIGADLISKKISKSAKGQTLGHFRSLIRHDSKKLAAIIATIG